MSDTNIQKVSNKEAMWFMVSLIVSKILFSDITKLVSHSGNGAYFQALWCGLIALVIFLVSSKLSNNTSLFDASLDVLGNVGLRILGAVLTILFLLNTGVMLRVYSDIIRSIILPEASGFLVMLFLVVTTIVTAFAGIGTLTAYSYGAGIILVASLIVILALNIPNYDITNAYTLFGKGGRQILSGINGLTPYADIFLLFLMTPFLKNKEDAKRSGVRTIIISSLIIGVTTFLYILTIPDYASSHFTLPVLEIAFDVNLDIIFQRAEGLFLFMWILSGFLSIGAYICFAVWSFEKSFKLSDRRGVIGLFVFIASCIALMLESISGQKQLYEALYNVFTIAAFTLPVFIFGIRKIKRR